MNLTDFEFAQPAWFLALLLPLLVMGWIRYTKPRILRIRAYADAHLLPYLLLNAASTTYQHRKTTGIWAILWLLGIFALAGPRWDYETQEVIRPHANLMILLDLSESMQVKDLPHARLEQALQEIEELIDKENKMYMGLMVFAGIPHLVAPLSDDYHTLRHLLYELTPDIVPVQGSYLARALADVGRWLNNQATYDTPHVLLISDGEFDPNDMQDSLAVLEKQPFYLHTLGVGTPQGDFIPVKDGTWQKDAQGEVVISRLNEPYLQQLAQAGQGIYRRADYRTQDTETILAQVEKNIRHDEQDKTLQKLWHERFYLGVIPMLILLLPWFRRQKQV